MLIVDFNSKSAKKDGKDIIVNGIPQNGYEISKDPVTFEDIEILYEAYKYSVPDRVRFQRTFFRALPEDRLSDEDLIVGEPRQAAREKLELAVLEGSLNGSLKWPDPKKWFWQSEKDPDLVILQKWVA